MSTRRLSAALLGAALVLSSPAPARACGGMVFPAHEERVGGMSDQELFVYFGGEETVLVASAGYRGVDTSEFAFILPLAQQPQMVEDGDTALFVALDELAAPRVAIFVDDGEPLGLCGATRGDGGFNGGEGDGEVMIHQRGRTATYEYVVIGGDTGTAVADWLTGAGYPLPADYAAALDPYVEGGWYFFAAKVLSDAAEGALKPIELHLPPATPETFRIPFGVAAHSLAPGDPLAVTTYFLAGGPVLPANYESRAVDPDELRALSETETNYAELERAILEEPDGAFVIDYSSPASLDMLKSAYDEGVWAERVDPEASDAAYLDAFFTRLGVQQAHLTRVRAELGATQIGDLDLRRALGPDVNSSHTVTFEADDASRSCAVDRRGNLAQFLLLVPVLAWIRPRRRAT